MSFSDREARLRRVFRWRLVDIEPEGWCAIVDPLIKPPHSPYLAIYAPWHREQGLPEKAMRKMRANWAQAEKRMKKVDDMLQAYRDKRNSL